MIEKLHETTGMSKAEIIRESVVYLYNNHKEAKVEYKER